MNQSPRRGGGGVEAAQRAAAGPGAAEQRGGAVPATSGVHTLQRPGPGDLWNVLALTEQRRRRTQATLGPSARPPRQAAQPIGWSRGLRVSGGRGSPRHHPREALAPGSLLDTGLQACRGSSIPSIRGKHRVITPGPPGSSSWRALVFVLHYHCLK